MFAATRRWFNRNRTPLAIGAGVIGAGYVATQYLLSKLNDARERMSSDRIAKENLRRRFEQNQEDCTFTVLALLPTATAGILEALDTERITYEIQTMKAQKASAHAGSTAPSLADTTLTEEDARSGSLAASSVQSESGVHASQVVVPPQQAGEGAQDGGVSTQPQPQQQQQQKPRRSKRQLWDDLTISSITRSFTLIYTLALLTMLTRIQLNLLGRRSYLSSVVSLAAGGSAATSAPISLENNDDDSPDHAYGNDFETNRKYLAFSWWLLNRGWRDLSDHVEAAVRQVFGDLSPRDLLSFQRFAELTLEVRKVVEGGTPKERRENPAWLRFLLPGREDEDEVIRASGILAENEGSTVDLGAPSSADDASSPVSLRRLLDETSDLIESPAFSHVLTLLLDTGFSQLVDRNVAASAFELPPEGAAAAGDGDDLLVGGAPLGTTLDGAEERAVLRNTRVVQLPRILSVVTRQAHVIGNGMPNEYLREMERVGDLEGFAAVVYSSNWESEVMRDQGLAGQQQQQQQQQQAAAAQTGGGDESLVVVDPQGFESAWGKALGNKA